MFNSLLSFFRSNRKWILLNIPFYFMVALLIWDKNYWEALTPWSAYFALTYTWWLLMMNPLRSAFPSSSILRKMMPYRRSLGVASFNYALVHLVCFIIKRGGIMATVKWVAHPVLMPGFIAFVIFIPLTITSNNFSLKRMGYTKWKKLHKTTYIAEVGIFLHMVLRGGEHLVYALLFFIPLFYFQWLRRRKSRSA